MVTFINMCEKQFDFQTFKNYQYLIFNLNWNMTSVKFQLISLWKEMEYIHPKFYQNATLSLVNIPGNHWKGQKIHWR